jgi:hypothetical protein
LQVKAICSTLPHYTAIAHFKGGVFDKSFKTSNAGVFIGCANDHFKVYWILCPTCILIYIKYDCYVMSERKDCRYEMGSQNPLFEALPLPWWKEKEQNGKQLMINKILHRKSKIE